MFQYIKVIILGLIIFSCSIGKQNTFNNDLLTVIAKELKRSKLLKRQNNIYLEFNQNNYLREYLENLTLKIKQQQDLKYHLEKEIADIILNTNELNFLIKQTRKKYDNHYSKLKLGNEIILISEADKKLDKENTVSNILREKVFLSNPIFSKNRDLCLIAFANGFENQMQGGINIYKKEKDDWKIITTVNSWIE